MYIYRVYYSCPRFRLIAPNKQFWRVGLLHKSSSNHNPPDADQHTYLSSLYIYRVYLVSTIHRIPSYDLVVIRLVHCVRRRDMLRAPDLSYFSKNEWRKQSPRPHPICGVRWTARWKLARWIILGHPQRHRIRPRCKVYHSCRRPFPVQWERHRSRCLSLILWLRTPSVAWHPLTRHTPRACHSSPSCVNMSRSPLQWAPLAHSSRTACRPSLVGCRRRCNRL